MTAPGCTGVTATWCPACGSCACPGRDDGAPGELALDDPACRLHAPASPHGTIRALHPAGVPTEDEDPGSTGWPVACPACGSDAFRLTPGPVFGARTTGTVQVDSAGVVVAYSAALACAGCDAPLDPSTAPPMEVHP